MLNPQQIRKALVRLAEFQGRPYYDLMAVRHIVQSFAWHPLREAILYFHEQDPSEQQVRVHELTVLCRTNSIRDYAESLTGLPIRALLNEELLITNTTWFSLKQHWDSIEARAFDEAENRKKKRKRGWVKLTQTEMFSEYKTRAIQLQQCCGGKPNRNCYKEFMEKQYELFS